MLKDRYDWIHVSLLAVVLAVLAIMLGGKGVITNKQSGKASPDKALERAIAYQARVEFLRKTYAPVESLRSAGRYQEALFKLDELAEQYPNEAHGRILKGEILYGMGALGESVASFVEGVRLNGDYVDRKSPLSRRGEIGRVAEDGLKIIGAKARANPDNRSIVESQKNVNYLRSRLAGGCE